MGKSGKLELDSTGKALVTYMNVCCAARLFPYRWCPRKEQLIYLPALRYNIGHNTVTGLGILHMLYMGVQVIRSFGMESWTLASKTRLYYLFTASCCTTLGCLLNMSNFGKHHTVVNQVLDIGRKLTESEMSEKRKGLYSTTSTFSTWAVRSIMYLQILAVTTNPVRVFSDPRHPTLLSSFLPHQSLSIPSKLSLYMVQFGLILGVTSQLFPFLAIIIYYSYIVKLAITKLSLVASIGQIYTEYRRIFVLQALFQSSFGGWLLSLIVFGISVIILAIYQGVCFHDLRSLIFGGIFFWGFFYLIKIGGDVDTASENVIKGWRRSRRSDDSGPGPLIRSCQPIRMKAGNFFYLDRGFYLTFLDVIFKNAITLILYTYKK